MRKGSKEIIEEALKAGADILADGFRSEIETIPTDDWHLPEGQMRQGIRTLLTRLEDYYEVIANNAT